MNKSSEDQTQTNQVWGTNVSNLSWQWRRRQRYLLSRSCGGVGGKQLGGKCWNKNFGEKSICELFLLFFKHFVFESNVFKLNWLCDSLELLGLQVKSIEREK